MLLKCCACTYSMCKWKTKSSFSLKGVLQLQRVDLGLGVCVYVWVFGVKALHKNATYLGVEGQIALFAWLSLFVKSVIGQRLKFYESMHAWVNKQALGTAVKLINDTTTESQHPEETQSFIKINNPLL